MFINSSNFSCNHAPQAGAVCIEALPNCILGNFVIFETIFDKNMATEGHAGVVAAKEEIQHLELLVNVTFTNNTAPHSCAGAVHIESDAAYYTHTRLRESTFRNNWHKLQFCSSELWKT